MQALKNLTEDEFYHGPAVVDDSRILWHNAAMPADQNPLSKREQEILELVARGLTNQEIARDLVISPNTVKVHLRNIFAKLEVASRTEAIVKAAQAGWIEVAGLEESEAAEPTAAPVYVDPPLARWQRVYFVVAALAVLAILLIPGLSSRLEAQMPRSDLSDAGEVRFGRAGAGRRGSLEQSGADGRRRAVAWRWPRRVIWSTPLAAKGATGSPTTVAVYDPDNNGWLEAGPLPQAVSNVQAAELGGLLYLPGGSNRDGAGDSPASGLRPGRRQLVARRGLARRTRWLCPGCAGRPALPLWRLGRHNIQGRRVGLRPGP